MGQTAVLENRFSPQDHAYDVNMTVGEILRESRQRYKLSLEEIETTLRIKSAHLDAIENNNFNDLPGSIYTVGFIRSYSDYLGLDSGKIISLFKSQSNTKIQPTNLESLIVEDEQTTLPSKWLVMMSVAALGVLCFSWNVYNNANIVEAMPSVPARLLEQTGQAVSVSSSNVVVANRVIEAKRIGSRIISTAAFGPPPLPKGVALRVQDDTWIEIKNAQGRALISRVLKSGEGYLIPSKQGMSMSIGNAGGVTLSIGDRPIKILGVKGQVIRNIDMQMASVVSRFGFADSKPALSSLDSLN